MADVNQPYRGLGEWYAAQRRAAQADAAPAVEDVTDNDDDKEE